MIPDFYTNAECFGSKILYRGVENGKRVRRKLDYSPTLFVPSQKPTGYTTLYGEPVAKIQPGNVKECKDYLRQYSGVSGHTIYGQTRFEYCWINDTYPDVISWDRKSINIANIDIEVYSEIGFPDPTKADGQMTAITVKSWNYYHVFCLFDYKAKSEDVIVHVCEDEEMMLREFLDFWQDDYPDAITGWNCIPINSNIWTKDKILTINSLTKGDILYDSKVINVSPINKKEAFDITLSGGHKLVSSKDHIFKIRSFPKNKYTSLNIGGKSLTKEEDLKLCDIDMVNQHNYIPFPKRTNTNPNNPKYTLDELYLMGLCYADGTRDKNQGNINYCNRMCFYNTDEELCNFVHNFNDTPHVVISPASQSASQLNYYTSRNNSSFQVCSSGGSASGTSIFDYIVID